MRWLDGGTRRKVSCVMLRKAAAGQLETDLVPEFRVVRALWGSGVPVARALWIDIEGRWLERPSFIVEKVAGATDFFALLKPEMAASSRAIAQQLAAIAATLHARRLEKAGRRFSSRHDTPDGGSSADIVLGVAVSEASDGAASGDGRGLHLAEGASADRPHNRHRARRFPPGNFLYEGDRINAMLDWEMVHLGDPVEDIAWAYRTLWGPQAFLSLDEFVERYTELSGIPVDPETLLFLSAAERSEAQHYFLDRRAFLHGWTDAEPLPCRSRLDHNHLPEAIS